MGIPRGREDVSSRRTCLHSDSFKGVNGGRDAQTSTLRGHSTDTHPVDLCGPHHLDVWLLCPDGDHVPQCVRLVPECASLPVVSDARVSLFRGHVPTIASRIPCGAGAHAPTKGSLRLRLGSSYLVMIATPSGSAHACASCGRQRKRVSAGAKRVSSMSDMEHTVHYQSA